MSNDHLPETRAIPHIICAACRWKGMYFEGAMILSARHWDEQMRFMADSIGITNHIAWEQGFVDQFNRFYSREEAMQLVKSNGQPFNNERNGGSETELFSEGLY